MCNLKGANGTLGPSYPNPLCTSGRSQPPQCPRQQVRVHDVGGEQRSQPPPRPVEIAAAPPPSSAGASAQRPHIFMFLQDDLGHDDVAFNGNKVNLDVTSHITAAAEEGIVLKRHYVHWHCSPTRRSFLTGKRTLCVWVCVHG